ncbi:hypothetical protein OVA07_05725 [Novosphingobium sp. SL115]|uniref:hypothetical protein n=1 Tax=Novosphingobium sp. SL115 TaxID=2995150 RepID=UPI0022758C51|nr:hypothetical protein [Novosphingobium sp. SL115]MCY1670509.1 hypothetical protein [Novosphingobium sp. SL115]
MVDARYTTRPPKAETAGDDGAWFAAKRYGCGAGMPLRWQGWALLLSYFAVLAGVIALDRSGNGAARGAGFALFIAATAVLMVVSARHTRGGWKWRWGSKD